jgi:hypothetical protein
MNWKDFYKDCFGHHPRERQTTWSCIVLMLTVAALAAVLL